MSSHSVFIGCDDAVKARLEKYWAKKLPRVQKLLAPYRADLQEIRLTVYHHQQNPKRSWYEVRAVIHLPSGTLAAEANDKDPEAAVDQVTDALVTEIKRHKERVRKDYLYKRKTRSHADLRSVAPLLQRDLENGRRQEFFQLLRPLLRFLHDHASRELRVLELEGKLHRGEVTVADLMDEVLIRAWHQFKGRPQHMPLELWLTDLLHQALEELVKQEFRPHVSLEETDGEALPNEAPPLEEKQQKEEKEWWDELPPFEEKVLLEDLIPGSEGKEPWDELEAEEQRDRMLSLLRELPAAQRQAFQLHVLEDYDTDEIAMLQDRPESQVKADIEAARQTLRNRLLASGYLQRAGQAATTFEAVTQKKGT